MSEAWSRRRTVGKGRNTGGTDLVSKGAEGMGWGDVWHRGGQPGGRGPQVRPRRIPRGCGESKGKEREGVRMMGVCAECGRRGNESGRDAGRGGRQRKASVREAGGVRVVRGFEGRGSAAVAHGDHPLRVQEPLEVGLQLVLRDTEVLVGVEGLSHPHPQLRPVALDAGVFVVLRDVFEDQIHQRRVLLPFQKPVPVLVKLLEHLVHEFAGRPLLLVDLP